MEVSRVRQAWEAFVQTGEKPPSDVRRIVAASWGRSSAFRIRTDNRKAPLASEAEVHRHRLDNLPLLKAAEAALDRSRLFLGASRAMMVLTDAKGTIIATEGDPRVVDSGRENHLERGGRWSEDVIGTNAIGTALAEGRPIQIHGHEHFCEGVQRWTCAAVPVRHPLDDELLGIIDISGPAEHFNPQSLALAGSIAQEVTASLDRAIRIRHEALLRRFIARRPAWLSDDMLVLDPRGFLVHAAGKPGAGLVEGNRVAAVRSLPIDEWPDVLQRRVPGARTEIVREDGEALGAIVVMARPGRARAATAPAPGAPAIATPREARRIGFDEILGESEIMRRKRDKAARLAASGLPILIEGETGVGKELFARAIHAASRAEGHPFIPVNCGGMPRELIASELFGYAKGAFTGADEKGRTGKIVASDGGTLCLDEIGEMPMELQPYLLRVLEDGEVFPVGAHEGRAVDMRLVSMTNRNLADEVDAGRFRRDLYYRVAAARIQVPPLRARGDDVVLLAGHFARLAATRLGLPAPAIDPRACDLLLRYPWPGNVRELRNMVDTLVVLTKGDRIGPDDLPREFAASAVATPPHVDSADLRAIEKAAVIACLEKTRGNCKEAARLLGIARSTLYVRLAEYGIPRPRQGRG
ncbi:sigma-54-dependent Fis family transcriptional regulator [Zavarzinia aquatilis]|uniref:Sigma-54-dependent Fis family transcriptional regulator n=1 Tax=Zavarzinia aquatilis TaxID=2211142 RepID=A0A317EC44_9PROT|nr:sigma-54-dependent Fis family transcriptional regulator [Zavarzinia aquatilis]PWR24499.1 sigma-54-dependent Fis family transcriptional regulator [Zavarzinia aquatilis]